MNQVSRLDNLSLPQQKYLEVIAELGERLEWIRITDIAKEMHVKPPSVSEEVKRMEKQGLVKRGPRKEVVLSNTGQELAGQLERRHKALQRFMVSMMAMDKSAADELACRIEHSVSREFADRLGALMEYMEKRHPAVIKDMARRLNKAG